MAPRLVLAVDRKAIASGSSSDPLKLSVSLACCGMAVAEGVSLEKSNDGPVVLCAG